MAIEGPLRELGIHDVFQLLDLSRKTGILRVTSELRDDEGSVAFDGGRVVLASIRSRAEPLEMALLQAGRISESDLSRARARQRDDGRHGDLADVLIEIGALTQRELERHIRQQIESGVFELMSWSEGYFSFEERSREEMPRVSRVAVSTESLLMEGARRIDEWSRIADTVPSLDVVAELAAVQEEREGALLELLPHEWEVLTMIDASRDLRNIAAALGRDGFEVAKIAYGLVRTGVVTVRRPERASRISIVSPNVDTASRLAQAQRYASAGRHDAALDELRSAVRADPLTADVHRALGFAAARVGNLDLARDSWKHYLCVAPGTGAAPTVERALDALDRFTALIDAHVAD